MWWIGPVVIIVLIVLYAFLHNLYVAWKLRD